MFGGENDEDGPAPDPQHWASHLMMALMYVPPAFAAAVGLFHYILHWL